MKRDERREKRAEITKEERKLKRDERRGSIENRDRRETREEI